MFTLIDIKLSVLFIYIKVSFFFFLLPKVGICHRLELLKLLRFFFFSFSALTEWCFTLNLRGFNSTEVNGKESFLVWFALKIFFWGLEGNWEKQKVERYELKRFDSYILKRFKKNFIYIKVVKGIKRSFNNFFFFLASYKKLVQIQS